MPTNAQGLKRKKKKNNNNNNKKIINGVRGKLLSAIQSFYEEASACVKIGGGTSEHFEIKVGL